MSEIQPDILVVGAGPAGLAAADAAARGGANVLVLDLNPAPGGQIWRGVQTSEKGVAGDLLRRVHAQKHIQILSQASVNWAEPHGSGWRFTISTPEGVQCIRPGRVIMATGATEIFVPFPGWTLPGVLGAGGLQAMVKSGLDVRGQRVVLAGSGPLLFAVATTLKQKGANVLAVAEQTPTSKLMRFGLSAGKPRQASELLWQMRGTPFWPGTYPIRAEGQARLEAVTLKRPLGQVRLECDWLASGFGLQPDLRVAAMLGCHVQNGAVNVNSWQQTSVPGVYAAGEITGVGGVEKALAEGRWAGLAATGQTEHLYGRTPSEGYAPFVRSIAKNFTPRPELRALPDAQTIICRCEDVRHTQLQNCHSWTAAKLHTRCGMGTCQGRICGPATQLLYGWTPAGQPRPPLTPTPIATLLESG